ncbi:hypothetical protein [Nocardioides nitrophenolicus]|uniref:hypothetical protein n=1 Tax=Nocardioides nitrophenolicus TaxID=60489 RepID=UPI00195E3EC8|nr:hypothetical protein [Nocardioides nitrophenolicus]MBM7515051.1 hypothetical protein [Nocardioides nitrophenolicus]
MTDSSLLPWAFDDIAAFGARPHLAAHRLHEQPAFTDDALADLLDRLPRSVVHPYTMGADPTRPDEWRRGAETDLPGKELLEVVSRGHLWLNLVGVDRHDPEIAGLVADLYAEIRALVPGFAPLRTSATLLLSSPTAMVYYHADNQPNLLWHLRGRKRAYVYPRASRFVSDENLERLVAGETEEELPFELGYDDQAAVLDLEPGQVAWWPQNSPHRVENVGGLNVSLSTEHWTAESVRREHLWTANYYLRSRLGRAPRSTREHGLLPAAKVAAMRVGRRVGVLDPGQRQGPRPSFTVDPDVGTGVGALTPAG